MQIYIIFKAKNIDTINEQATNNLRSTNNILSQVKFSKNLVNNVQYEDSKVRLGPLIRSAWNNPIRARQVISGTDISLYRFGILAKWVNMYSSQQNNQYKDVEQTHNEY